MQQSSNAAQLCHASAAKLEALVADIGAVTEHTTHVSEQFAVIWDAAQCECTKFQDDLTPWTSPSSQMFCITLPGSAAEDVRITCLNGYADKDCSYTLIRDSLAELDRHPAYIFGGCFGSMGKLLTYYMEKEVRAQKLTRQPLLLKSTAKTGSNPALFVGSSDAFGVRVVPDTTPLCTRIALTISAKPSESHEHVALPTTTRSRWFQLQLRNTRSDEKTV